MSVKFEKLSENEQKSRNLYLIEKFKMLKSDEYVINEKRVIMKNLNKNIDKNHIIKLCNKLKIKYNKIDLIKNK